MYKKNLLLIFLAGITILLFVFLLSKETKLKNSSLRSTPQPADVKNLEAVKAKIDNFKEITEAAIDTSDWQAYRNEEYGFEVRIPSGWPKFKVRQRSVPYGSSLLEFGFMTKIENWGALEKDYAFLWGIEIFPKEQFQKYFYPDGISKPTIFKQNDKYVFVKSYGQDIPEKTSEWMTNSEAVFATFKFIE